MAFKSNYLALVCATTGLTWLLMPCSVQAEPGEVLRAKFESKWNEQRNAIHTAEVSFLAFRRSPPNNVSEVEFLRLLRNTDLFNPPAREAFFRTLDPSLPKDQAVVTSMHMKISGDSELLEEKHDAGENTTLKHGVDEIRKDDYRSSGATRANVNILPRGGKAWHSIGLGDLRYLPSPFNAARYRMDDSLTREQTSSKFVISDYENGLNSSSELLVDNQSGLVFRFRGEATLPGKDVPEAVKLVIQQGPLKSLSKVVFPTSYVSAIFRRGRLDMVTATIIQEATFNSPVAEASFVVPVEKGTLVVDQRKDLESPGRVLADENAGDVIKFADQAEQIYIPKPMVYNKPVRSPRLVLVLTSLLLLVGGGVYLYRTREKR